MQPGLPSSSRCSSMQERDHLLRILRKQLQRHRHHSSRCNSGPSHRQRQHCYHDCNQHHHHRCHTACSSWSSAPSFVSATTTTPAAAAAATTPAAAAAAHRQHDQRVGVTTTPEVDRIISEQQMQHLSVWDFYPCKNENPPAKAIVFIMAFQTFCS